MNWRAQHAARIPLCLASQPCSAAQKSHDLALVWRTIYCVAGRPRDLPEVLKSRGESGSVLGVGGRRR